MFKKFGSVILLLLITVAGHSQQPLFEVSKERIKLQFSLYKDGAPFYAVLFNGKEVIKNSSMGFSLDSDSLFYKNFKVLREKMANNTLIIQNRTMTFGSGQPLSSK